MTSDLSCSYEFSLALFKVTPWDIAPWDIALNHSSDAIILLQRSVEQWLRV